MITGKCGLNCRVSGCGPVMGFFC